MSHFPAKRVEMENTGHSDPRRSSKKPRLDEIIDLTGEDTVVTKLRAVIPTPQNAIARSFPSNPNDSKEALACKFYNFVVLVAPRIIPTEALEWFLQTPGFSLRTWLLSLEAAELQKITGSTIIDGFNSMNVPLIVERVMKEFDASSERYPHNSNDESYIVRDIIAELVLAYRLDLTLWLQEDIPSKLTKFLNTWRLDRLQACRGKSVSAKILELRITYAWFSSVLENSSIRRPESHPQPGSNLPERIVERFTAEIARLGRDYGKMHYRERLSNLSREIARINTSTGTSLTEAVRRLVSTLTPVNTDLFERMDMLSQLVVVRRFWVEGSSLHLFPSFSLGSHIEGFGQNVPTQHLPVPYPDHKDNLPLVPEDFERFLEELQEDQDQDPNEGVNTAQDVLDAAKEINATPVGKDRYSMPGMLCELHSHQVIGIAWMIKREKEKETTGKRNKVRGGVLADAMGLGKTVQTLGLLVHNRLPNSGALFDRLVSASKAQGKRKITLILCPVALVHQWEREIRTKAPGCFEIRVHHGQTKLKSLAELQRYDIVITSYGTLTREYPIKKHRKTLTDYEKDQDEKRIEREKGFLFRVKYARIILDEAHIIKSPGANVSVATCNLNATTQWCLTGTPLLNKVDDIFPLLRVLQVPFFQDRKFFRQQITNDQKGATKLREILSPFLKRRTKDDKIAGRAVLTLPEKHIRWLDLKLDDDESALYKQVQDSMVSEINKFLREGVAVKRVNHIFAMILRLRQLCIHPYLILEHLASKSGVGSAEFVRGGNGIQSFSDLFTRGALALTDSIICGMCQEEAEKPVMLESCKHCFCNECIATIADDQTIVCPVCRESSRVIAFDRTKYAPASITDTDQPISTPNAGQDQNSSTFYHPMTSNSIQPVNTGLGPLHDVTLLDSMNRNCTNSEHKSSEATLKTKPSVPITLDESDDDELPEFTLQSALQQTTAPKSAACQFSSSGISGSPLGTRPKLESQSGTPIKTQSSLGYAMPLSSKSSPQLATPQPLVTSEQQDTKPASTAYVVDAADVVESQPGMTKEERQAEVQSWKELLKMDLVPSTKLTAVETHLEEWMVEDDCKLIVFSQFVKALDLVGKICESHGWDALHYQGSMNMRERESTIMNFEEPDGPRILLMSLKAGGVGLNLTCANKVIMLDFWWNAAAEFQAIDRCHRMGQTKEVTVIRAYLPGTVEERIKLLQDEKLKTAGLVLGETETGGRMARLGMRELMGLFGRVTTNADGIQQIETR